MLNSPGHDEQDQNNQQTGNPHTKKSNKLFSWHGGFRGSAFFFLLLLRL
jgi:hypothetical protein